MKLFRFSLKKTSPRGYKRMTVGGNACANLKEFEEINRKTLRLNGVNTNKIRFVSTPVFGYDVDDNVINPQYDVCIPLNGKGEVIEINKPKNFATVIVNTYKVEDNYEFLAELVKNTKKGIVICIDTRFRIETDTLRLRDLDEITIEPEESQEIL